AAAMEVIGSSHSPSVAAADAPSNQIPVREAFETLTSAESTTLDAMISRIIPSDENGPGAHEARAIHFIDRALAGPMSEHRAAYGDGLLALNDYTMTSRGKVFHLLSHTEQDEVLEAMATGGLSDYPGAGAGFFNMV